MMKKINEANYRKDQLYPVVTRCVAEMLKTSNVIAPIEVMLKLQRITKQQYEDWRFGRIPYLERVCLGNLSKLSRLLRILDQHARTMGLKPSQTVYHKWGKGGKRVVLRFSKSGNPNLEAAYSRHYVAINRNPQIAATKGSTGQASPEITETTIAPPLPQPSSTKSQQPKTTASVNFSRGVAVSNSAKPQTHGVTDST